MDLSVIRTIELTKRFGDLTAADAVSFEVARLGIFGLLGPNGAGKSTVIKMLTTLLPPTSGDAWVAGFSVTREAAQVRRSIGYVPQMLGNVMAHVRGVPTGSLGYPDFMTPGILAQSALFISIFYGIAAIWERDLGILQKLLVSPAPREALVLGKALSASARGLDLDGQSAILRGGRAEDTHDLRRNKWLWARGGLRRPDRNIGGSSRCGRSSVPTNGDLEAGATDRAVQTADRRSTALSRCMVAAVSA